MNAATNSECNSCDHPLVYKPILLPKNIFPFDTTAAKLFRLLDLALDEPLLQRHLALMETSYLDILPFFAFVL